jgi:hypothetical protein
MAGNMLDTILHTTVEWFDAEFASEALKRARKDRLVPGYEVDGLTAQVPQKIKLWRDGER